MNSIKNFEISAKLKIIYKFNFYRFYYILKLLLLKDVISKKILRLHYANMGYLNISNRKIDCIAN